MSNREQALLGEGFQRVATVPVGVPHHVWKAELDVEFDRSLRLAEDAILKLVAAGVGDPVAIANLLGIVGEPIVPRYIADLMIKGLLSRDDERLIITALGRKSLNASLTREERTYGVEFRHDPYRDEFRWGLDDELKQNQLEAAGLKSLPAPDALTHGELVARHRDLQALVARDGMPFDADAKKNDKRRREVLRARPVKYYIAYRPAELEVWFRKESEELRWRLIREGGEERAISDKLLEMERDGVPILPMEDRREFQGGEKDAGIIAAVQHAETVAPPTILQTADHRPALDAAIRDAQRELVSISPWLRVAPVDQELLTWFRNSLDKHKSLRIVIGYGIEDEAAAARRGPTRKAGDQQEAIRRLRQVGQQYRGRLQLVEIGNTHQKVVLVDERYAIVTSFNMLSFNPFPGKVLREETGVRITDVAAVKKLKADLLAILGPSDREFGPRGKWPRLVELSDAMK